MMQVPPNNCCIKVGDNSQSALTMKSAQKSTFNSIHISIDNFSSSIQLPTRQRRSLLCDQLSPHSPLQPADSCSLGSIHSHSPSSHKHSEINNSNHRESVSAKLHSPDNKQELECSSGGSLSSFLFHESDSLLNRYNPLFSQAKTQGKQQGKHSVQSEEQFLIAPAALESSRESERIEQILSQMNVTQQQPCPHPLAQQHQQYQSPSQHQSHQQRQLPSQHEQHAFSEQQPQEQQPRTQQPQQPSSYYTQWPEEFDQPTMTRLYHNYSPSHCDPEELTLILHAIVQAEQSQKCGKPFLEEAFEHYRGNYGRMSEEAFKLKVVGDVLYLFRRHNQERQKFEKERVQYQQKEKKQKNRTKF